MTTTAAISFQVNAANKDAILRHLVECDHLFRPALHLKVDLPAYALKIEQLATRFEAWDGHLLVGLVATYFNDALKAFGFITNVSTMEQYGGRGIGSALMAQCLEYGRAEGFREIGLEVHRESIQAIQLYRKFGFETTEEKGDFLKMLLSLQTH